MWKEGLGPLIEWKKDSSPAVRDEDVSPRGRRSSRREQAVGWLTLLVAYRDSATLRVHPLPPIRSFSVFGTTSFRELL